MSSTAQTTKQEYRQFIYENFNRRSLGQPLFYSSKFGLRFDLQTGEISKSSRHIIDDEGNVIPQIGDTNKDEYFQEVIRRASIPVRAVVSTDRQYMPQKPTAG